MFIFPQADPQNCPFVLNLPRQNLPECKHFRFSASTKPTSNHTLVLGHHRTQQKMLFLRRKAKKKFRCWNCAFGTQWPIFDTSNVTGWCIAYIIFFYIYSIYYIICSVFITLYCLFIMHLLCSIVHSIIYLFIYQWRRASLWMLITSPWSASSFRLLSLGCRNIASLCRRCSSNLSFRILGHFSFSDDNVKLSVEDSCRWCLRLSNHTATGWMVGVLDASRALTASLNRAKYATMSIKVSVLMQLKQFSSPPPEYPTGC